MAIHNALGKAGEDAAAAYLERNGYEIRDGTGGRTIWNWISSRPKTMS